MTGASNPYLAEVDYRCLTRGGLWGGLWGRGLGVGVGSFFVGFRGRVRVGDSIRGVIYDGGKDLFTFFVYLPSGHPIHPL